MGRRLKKTISFDISGAIEQGNANKRKSRKARERVCVCEYVREREREREAMQANLKLFSFNTSACNLDWKDRWSVQRQKHPLRNLNENEIVVWLPLPLLLSCLGSVL